MKNEQIRDFTRRLSQCNKGEMIVIIYDIYFAYAKDAKEAYQEGSHDYFKHSIHKAQDVLTQLMGDLDFAYPLAKNLYALYLYARNSLSTALYKNNLDPLLEAERIMLRLYDSFREAARSDTSGPIMSNTQQVYAGMTYGPKSLNENYMENQARGFFA